MKFNTHSDSNENDVAFAFSIKSKIISDQATDLLRIKK